jgi:hypothetical protein
MNNGAKAPLCHLGHLASESIKESRGIQKGYKRSAQGPRLKRWRDEPIPRSPGPDPEASHPADLRQAWISQSNVLTQ